MSNDSTTVLNTPIVEDGLRRIPFFNGRVLTAEDLETEQDANATERRRLGRALGTGVLEGLFVERGSGDPPTTVTVESGLALAPSGQIVELPKETTVSVVSRIEREETAGTKGAFKDCEGQDVTEMSGTGAYLLFVEPASEARGRTSRTRLGGDGAATTCGAKHRVEGARLRLKGLSLSMLASMPLDEAIQERSQTVTESRRSGDDPSVENVSMLRSLMAHACLGTATTAGEEISLAEAFRGPGEHSVRYGPVDDLRQENKLPDDAVPIGLLYWSYNRIEFVDVWAVRRRVYQKDSRVSTPATDRRQTEAEAAVFQFHDQVDALQDRGHQVSQIAGDQLFAYLPPVGVIGGEMSWPVLPPPDLPLRWRPLSTAGAAKSSGEPELPAVPPFFEGLTVGGPSFIEPQRLRALTGESLQYPPVALDPSFPPDPGPEDEPGPLMWLYLLAPNAPEEDVGPPFLFTTGYAPFLGDAQYNLSRINRATYSSTRGPPSGS